PVVAFGERVGIRWLWQSHATAVRADGQGHVVELATPSGAARESASLVLNATGRVPALEDLGLDRAGVSASGRGVEVDPYLRATRNPRIYAGGDAHGRFQLSPVASYEGRVIARNFLEGPTVKVDYTALPRAVFLTPPLAAVGLSEEEAEQAGVAVAVAHNDM